jgi:hypothetical protein
MLKAIPRNKDSDGTNSLATVLIGGHGLAVPFRQRFRRRPVWNRQKILNERDLLLYLNLLAEPPLQFFTYYNEFRCVLDSESKKRFTNRTELFIPRRQRSILYDLYPFKTKEGFQSDPHRDQDAGIFEEKVGTVGDARIGSSAPDQWHQVPSLVPHEMDIGTLELLISKGPKLDAAIFEAVIESLNINRYSSVRRRIRT